MGSHGTYRFWWILLQQPTAGLSGRKQWWLWFFTIAGEASRGLQSGTLRKNGGAWDNSSWLAFLVVMGSFESMPTLSPKKYWKAFLGIMKHHNSWTWLAIKAKNFQHWEKQGKRPRPFWKKHPMTLVQVLHWNTSKHSLPNAGGQIRSDV